MMSCSLIKENILSSTLTSRKLELVQLTVFDSCLLSRVCLFAPACGFGLVAFFFLGPFLLFNRGFGFLVGQLGVDLSKSLFLSFPIRFLFVHISHLLFVSV